MSDFRTLLSKPAGTAERPKPLPAGSYICRAKTHTFGKCGYNQELDQLRINLDVVQAGEDVQAELLNGIKLEGRMLRGEFEISDENLYKLDALMKQLVPERMASGATLQELVETEINGKFFLCDVTCTPDKKDAENFFNNVRKMVPHKG